MKLYNSLIKTQLWYNIDYSYLLENVMRELTCLRYGLFQWIVNVYWLWSYDSDKI